MASTIIKQGDDKEFNIPITETPAIDFTTAEDIIVILFIGDNVQKKYSLNTKTDYGTVEVDGTLKNQLNVFVEREHSINFEVGTLRAYILAQFTNADFPDGKEVKSWDVTIGRSMAGKGLDEIL